MGTGSMKLNGKQRDVPLQITSKDVDEKLNLSSIKIEIM